MLYLTNMTWVSLALLLTVSIINIKEVKASALTPSNPADPIETCVRENLPTANRSQLTLTMCYCSSLKSYFPDVDIKKHCTDVAPNKYLESNEGLKETPSTIRDYIGTMVGIQKSEQDMKLIAESFTSNGYNLSDVKMICKIYPKCIPKTASIFGLSGEEWRTLKISSVNKYACILSGVEKQHYVKLTELATYFNAWWKTSNINSCTCDELMRLLEMYYKLWLGSISPHELFVDNFKTALTHLCKDYSKKLHWTLDQLTTMLNIVSITNTSHTSILLFLKFADINSWKSETELQIGNRLMYLYTDIGIKHYKYSRMRELLQLLRFISQHVIIYQSDTVSRDAVLILLRFLPIKAIRPCLESLIKFEKHATGNLAFWSSLLRILEFYHTYYRFNI